MLVTQVCPRLFVTLGCEQAAKAEPTVISAPFSQRHERLTFGAVTHRLRGASPEYTYVPSKIQSVSAPQKVRGVVDESWTA